MYIWSACRESNPIRTLIWRQEVYKTSVRTTPQAVQMYSHCFSSVFLSLFLKYLRSSAAILRQVLYSVNDILDGIGSRQASRISAILFLIMQNSRETKIALIINHSHLICNLRQFLPYIVGTAQHL